MKRLILLVLIILLNGCIHTRNNYYYMSKPLSKNENDIKKYVQFYVNFDKQKKDSPIISLHVRDTRIKLRSNEYPIKILSPKIEIEYQNKKYTLNVDKENKNTIYIISQGVEIRGNFIAKIGKVQLSTGEIMNIPSLLFQKHMQVIEHDPIADTLNQHKPKKIIYSGAVEDYEKQKK